jgi:hypothetical protein
VGEWAAIQDGEPTASQRQRAAFQIEIPSISAILERPNKASIPLASDVVESWYRQDTLLHGQKEFFVADPDGYLYRFYEYIGQR